MRSISIFGRARRRAALFFRRGIWRAGSLEDKSLRGRGLWLLRVLSISYFGLKNNRLASRAAALSYYSLIAFAPLAAIGVMISGYALERREGDPALDALNRAMRFIAPPAAEYERLPPQSEGGARPAVNTELASLINHIVQSA